MNTIKKIGKALAESKAKIIMLAFSVIFCSATIYAAAANTYTITIEIDGVASRVVTMRESADDILAQVGLEIGENDIVVIMSDGAATGDTHWVLELLNDYEGTDAQELARQIATHSAIVTAGIVSLKT